MKTCSHCGRTSHHPQDEQHKYCGHCHKFYDDMIIYAPWTDEQVAALNRWQACDLVHPFTCGKRDHWKHRAVKWIGGTGIWKKAADADTLIATNNGWVCFCCDYTQNWAHDFMTQPPPEHPLKKMRKET